MLRLAPPIKYIRILAIAVILTSTGFLLLSHLTAVSPISHNEQSLQVSPTTFDIVAAARLEQLQTRYKEEEVQGEVGLKIGNPDWTEYVNDLQGVYEQFFQSSRTERRKGPRIDETRYTRTPNASSAVQDVREQLADSLNLSIESTTLHDSQGHKTQVRSIPHTIYTTSKTPTFPEQFASWKQLNSKDGWDVEYYDNERIWRWMVEIFDRQGRSSSSSTNVKKSGAEILRVYGQLPQGVQRADFFRYLVLLMKGGVYTDTDTSCVRPLRDWPGIRESHWDLETKTDPILSFLPKMYDLLAIALQKETAEALLTQDVHRRLTTQLESFESPRLVVALEYDHWTSGGGGQEWRELGLARGMQFVQWTMMAQPGHPVLLDTLSRIIKDVEINRVRDSPSHGTNGEEGESENRDRLLEVLDFTGPGVFSDAVFRYLLARWGVHPRDISGSSGPIRIGDVLIYPIHSFRADASEGYQGEHKLVWHGFYGSWKDE